MDTLKLVLPKGSLQQATMELFGKAGIRIYADERSYRPSSDDKELRITLVRAQEIPKYVEQGVFDCGITGYDWILENKSRVKEICELVYAKSGYRPVRWVVAVANDSPIRSVRDLKGKRVATELINYVKSYLNKKRIRAKVEFSWGATEIKAADGIVDAIVDITETGSSLRANNLRIVDTVLESTTRFIANEGALKDKFKKEKIDSLKILLKGALRAENMVGLKMNLLEKDLQKIMDLLPALKKPTVSHLTLQGWVALEVVMSEEEVKVIIPKLKRSGAQGIIEYPLNKVIL